VLGGVLGLLVGVGALAIPGIGRCWRLARWRPRLAQPALARW